MSKYAKRSWKVGMYNNREEEMHSVTTKSCLVCNNEMNNTVLNVTEMMFRTNDEFIYLNCSNCGCLSLINIPSNMSKYYPSSYYSFTKAVSNETNGLMETIKMYLRKSSMKGQLGIGTYLDMLMNKIRPIYYTWLKKDLISLDSKILDVGCGNGFLISEMQKYSFTNLRGIDLFIENNIEERNLKIYQSDIHSLKESQFDLIMYHHSFEHIANPHLELQAIYEKLKDNGILIIRVPVCDSYAFRHYQSNWVQLDAPRHYFLYTKKSMQILAKANGFQVYEFHCDSNAFQFVGSECYLHNKPLSDYQDLFTEDELKIWEEKSKELNQLQDGDSMCFYLKKILL